MGQDTHTQTNRERDRKQIKINEYKNIGKRQGQQNWEIVHMCTAVVQQIYRIFRDKGEKEGKEAGAYYWGIRHGTDSSKNTTGEFKQVSPTMF